ncbi:MAG: sulfatase-like hydrolase/transferase [Candidatus Latescibacteria bacterium]|jgi:hypothetical protein|nr:sulfatase-like hydrolase/transferase [Candidatus Latescibacterota bacterium]MBT4138394.1 sulfatase-like hydrolase/transferase [Candidatus Latescibacterota bacterium]
MPKPNIILILTDQQRWDSLGCNGNKFVSTPNVDRLAAEGANCTNSFTPLRFKHLIPMHRATSASGHNQARSALL